MMNLYLEISGHKLEFPSAAGYVRNVKLALVDKNLDSDGKRINSLRYLDQPVQKLVLLPPSET